MDVKEVKCFGLISESDFCRSELHGYEVDLSGMVLVPELRPHPCATARILVGEAAL